MTNLGEALLLSEIVARAQKVDREKGIPLGTLVVHPSDREMYELISVNNGVATVRLIDDEGPTREAAHKQFPLNEIFSMVTATKVAAEVGREYREATSPPGIAVLVIKLP